mgnify:CR=1 FL=1
MPVLLRPTGNKLSCQQKTALRADNSEPLLGSFPPYSIQDLHGRSTA